VERTTEFAAFGIAVLRQAGSFGSLATTTLSTSRVGQRRLSQTFAVAEELKVHAPLALVAQAQHPRSITGSAVDDRRARTPRSEKNVRPWAATHRESSRPAFLGAQYFDRVFQCHGGDDVCADAFAEQLQIGIRKRHATSDDIGLDVYKIVPCAPSFGEGVK
jgi:hypothetical protein